MMRLVGIRCGKKGLLLYSVEPGKPRLTCLPQGCPKGIGHETCYPIQFTKDLSFEIEMYYACASILRSMSP